ncbi:TPA: flagellar biosynthesis anti-sigma factor FlgM [Legionella pneumophila]|uniref:Negative regulator of flagellin synthesis n=2 Tax=Legionella pneumophila subsp. pneumophila TaxID=91891 RepID=Q5ZX26_LEGPH|nr:flagellar biosynthesis anti-sigma factor FlgM [Legionella pneumophila]ERH45251.1 negative regulator of flagellin synthesis [Legionella pneumophila str. Leg01/53]ERH45343.1 negative regulator of flagellin synthesis [Legionella pneumophila str. Leg01/11]ERI48551.1 negative regulator of flagellin synthesis [Legionella pneumophila str. Leg01/20]WBV62395.1 flagellar biosynthesis anti-sigma factor FlgM [Legionella pneumophila 130b]AAU26994.1 negative regulator of flagellin synthesis [Legionella p
MINTIEDIHMVNQINDSANLRHIDMDNRINAKHKEAQNPVLENNSADSVNLSSTSKQLEALKASLKDLPEINEARVLYFKAEIQSGQYEIDSSKIAHGMLNSVEMV